MINTLYSEILKLKRSFFLLIILAGGLVLPVALFLGWGLGSETIKWGIYLQQSETIMVVIVTPVFFSLISAYVFSREFTDKMVNTVYCCPISRTKIFVCKLLIIYLIITIVYIIHFWVYLEGD